MTDIKDLELRIKSAASTLEMLRGELEELRQQQQQERPEQEPLFGRWATHPEHGRGIIISDKPDFGGEVKFAYHWNPEDEDPTTCHYVNLGGLALDPVTLNTTEDFEDAPEGTIIECTNGDAFAKDKEGLWNDEFNDKNMNNYYAPARVIRWGDGK
ncbi:hypothetical protein [Corynebacterium sp. 805_CJEI]|uniref:hypothetical protein n=1 Tax=Corynebacterium sp. 805_CJEI TaxID=2715677 RepID=UPI000665A6C1|nr:hypothetical protein [Corynebacterium sp. 805_CJEI]